MALLASAWFLVESFLIPDGLVKWFYLSFYIHPFFLFFCQLFLWLKLLKNWILLITYYSLRVSSYVFSFFRNCVVCIFSFRRLTRNDDEASRDEEDKNVEIVHNKNQVVLYHQGAFSYTFSSVASKPCQAFLAKIEKDGFEEESHFKDDDGFSCSDTHKNTVNEKALVLFKKTDDDNDISVSCHDHDQNMEEQISLSLNYEDISRISDFSSIDVNFSDELLPSFRCSISPPAENSPSDYEYSSFVYVSNSPAKDDLDMNYEYPSVQYSSNSPAREEEEEEGGGPNYEYSSFVYRSKSAVEDDQDMKECSFIVCGSVYPAAKPAIHESEVDEFYNKYTEQMRWFDVLNYDRSYGISEILSERVSTCKSGRRRLLRSLESDLELVYVAQSCLSWEALHHQYKKMKVHSQKSGHVIFCNDVASEFQKFQVLLERFMEDEMCELSEKRVVKYVRRRSFLKNLLQVPRVPDVAEEEVEGEAVNGRDVLRAIEKCIKAFWNFVRRDDKLKPWWNSFWTYCSPLEDPRDLKLIAHLTTNLQKKELWLKNARGKKNCWIRKVMRPIIEDDEWKEMLFTMIEMKLISRVLQMSVISSSQLKWCQQKLNNIDFKHGKVVRTSTLHDLLFPA